MTKHTTGPWHITHDTVPYQLGYNKRVRDKHNHVICNLHVNEKHNGPLIVNAPEMHEVLTELLEWCRWNTRHTDPNSPHEILVRATAVLNKANTPIT
jgi:hypothetical protein